jgi:hypothetical protein
MSCSSLLRLGKTASLSPVQPHLSQDHPGAADPRHRSGKMSQICVVHLGLRSRTFISKEQSTGLWRVGDGQVCHQGLHPVIS